MWQFNFRTVRFQCAIIALKKRKIPYHLIIFNNVAQNHFSLINVPIKKGIQ